MTDGECALAAAVLTAGVVGNMQTQAQIPPDGKLLDQWTKAKNYYEFEVFKVFYNGVSQIATDPTDWPPPAQYTASGGTAGTPAVDPNLLGQLVAALKAAAGIAAPIAGAVGGPGAAAVAGAIGQVVANIPNPTVTPAAPATVAK